ncbi:hypothetical protein JW921_00045 [Candidatus Fermentibacterales bacterium]|nr:hypothetical protein [Candidatus Fermentibacterales bacterium]
MTAGNGRAAQRGNLSVRALACPCCAGPIEQQVRTGQSVQCSFCNTSLRIGPVAVEKRSEPVRLPGTKSLEIQSALIGRLYNLIRCNQDGVAAGLFREIFHDTREQSERAVAELKASGMVTRLGFTLALPVQRAVTQRSFLK